MHILTEPKNALTKQYQNIFLRWMMYILEFKEEAAACYRKKGNGTGNRRAWAAFYCRGIH